MIFFLVLPLSSSELVSLLLTSSRIGSCSSASASAIEEEESDGEFVFVRPDDNGIDTTKQALKSCFGTMERVE